VLFIYGYRALLTSLVNCSDTIGFVIASFIPASLHFLVCYSPWLPESPMI
jgi:hypothetical protein